MGIMLLLTLMMCLQITVAVAPSRPSSSAQTIQQMQQQAAALSNEVAELQQSVDEQLALLNSGALMDPNLLKNQAATMEAANAAARDAVQAAVQRQVNAQAMLNEVQQTAQASNQPQQIAELEKQNQELQKTIEQLKSGSRVVYNGHDSDARTCWLVEMENSTTFRAAELGRSQPPRTFASVDAVSAWILQTHQQGAAFLLIVKPQAASVLDGLSSTLRAANVAFGFDLLPQQASALDPVTGAAAP